ncbi:MAG: diphosphate--fructose-6-phosphate 1-phosphotransferase [SAR202 cluster bacterium]|nr:diphosphate--fructose-6-phosphate 1-phosphotransferase [SAR202 cluster bacterium]|tara:strand:- start:218 stop:1405 length:1188 start_codon:yes stop_codon:yes gene_type:complete
MKSSNALIIQSGGSTPVINQSLAGILRESKKLASFTKIYGAIHGTDGLLKRNITDLTNISSLDISSIATTPGAALGSSRYKITQSNATNILNILSDYKIAYLFIIGGNDSAANAKELGTLSKISGYKLQVIHVPKTIDNDLIGTDHSPGFGSTARFIALATMGAGKDAQTMGQSAPITIIEVMGRDAGWLAASSSIGKNTCQDPPHIVCVPEHNINYEHFLNQLENTYRQFGYAVAVVAENSKNEEGIIGKTEKALYEDQFGHKYFEGAGYHLSKLAESRLKVRVRYEKPGTIQRSMVSCISIVDSTEAEMVGTKAVQYALQGANEVMISIKRDQLNSKYSSSTELTPVKNVADKVKYLPANYFDNQNLLPTEDFKSYAIPLIGSPLPIFANLLK